jgi:hypothetical protein
MRHLSIASLCLAGVAACAFEPGGDPGGTGNPESPDAAPSPDVDAATPPPLGRVVSCRVEGSDLGVVGLVVDAGAAGQFRFERWNTAPGGELIGFALSGPTVVQYEVRAGRDRFWGQSLTWLHPDLLDGDPKPISRVEFCGGGPPN